MPLTMLVREAAVLIASAAGAYTDYRTGYIYDWTTLPLIALGLILNAYEGQFLGIGIGAAVFAIGYVLYYTGKLGGGDVKLYTGIALALPFYGGSTFILSAALLGGMAAVVFYSAYYITAYLRKGVDWGYNRNGVMHAAALLVPAIAYFWFISAYGFASWSYITVFGIPVIFGLAFAALEKGIRKNFFVQKVSVAALEDDELLAADFMEDKERREVQEKGGLGFKGVIGAAEKEKLSKAGVESIAVYRNLPRFGPFILAGAMLALALPGFPTLLFGGA